MQYTQLGRTGLKVSRLCLGTMNFGASADEVTSFAILDRAIDGGINFLDTANIYSSWVKGHVGGESEIVLGKWLKSKKRRDIIIATKVRGRMWAGANGEGLSRHHIIHAVEDSLKRLQTDYIDLYQTHWYDDSTPMEETLSALDSLVQSGKVRYIGASNHPSWMLMKSYWLSDINHLVRYESLQPHYSLFNRSEYERELEAVCADQTVAVIPYSPLAAGFATGKYTRGNKTPDNSRADGGLIQRLINNDDAYNALDVMTDIANDQDVPVAHVALGWLLAKPTITAPIIGARTVEQLEETIGAVDLQLNETEVSQLDEATKMF
jgi:aryl-alcohol dehydrogenase-like predicted oxidoreductase